MNLFKQLLNQRENNTVIWKIICIINRIDVFFFASMIRGGSSYRDSLVIRSKIKIRKNSQIIIGDGTIISNSRIIVKGENSSVHIGKKCNLSNVNITLFGNHANLKIGDSVTFNATKAKRVVINIDENHCVVIGDNCLFSKDVELYTTDFHKIFDSHGSYVNPGANIEIGAHCWIGMHSLILKGSKIGNNNIIGAGSLIAGDYSVMNSVLAGRPVKLIRENVTWEK